MTDSVFIKHKLLHWAVSESGEGFAGSHPTCRHGSCKNKVGGAAAQLLSLVVTAVDVNAVQSERPQVGDYSSLLVIHSALKERVFCLELFWVCDIIGVHHCGVPASAGHGGVGDLCDVSPLPFRSARKRKNLAWECRYLFCPFYDLGESNGKKRKNPKFG